jgi:hypothetical protein
MERQNRNVVGARVESGQTSLPVLRSVQVSWQISASVAYLRPESRPVTAGQPARVVFVGFFGLHVPPNIGQFGTQVMVVDRPPPFQEETGGVTRQFHQVRVIFPECRELRFSPGLSDSRVFDESSYDWSEVDGRTLPGESLDACLGRIRDTWKRTGLCPDPRMYKVSGSLWLRELNLPVAEAWKHYLLAGSDEYIEVIGRGWSWTLGQPSN